MSAEILPIANKNCRGWSSTAFHSPRRSFLPCGFVWWKSLTQEAWDFVIDQLLNFKENDYIFLKVFLHLFECGFFFLFWRFSLIRLTWCITLSSSCIWMMLLVRRMLRRKSNMNVKLLICWKMWRYDHENWMRIHKQINRTTHNLLPYISL